jgi:Uncharacterized protein conserved in bacteria (DUF2272)
LQARSTLPVAQLPVAAFNFFQIVTQYDVQLRLLNDEPTIMLPGACATPTNRVVPSADREVQMATMHVQSDSLNLRQDPQVAANNIIAVLVKAQPVSTLGPTDPAGWVKVQASVTGTLLEGFVSARLLRDPASDAKERLIAGAVAEWVRFDKGAGREHVGPFHTFVGEMWSAIGQNLDGRDRDQPWSAAFISWIVRRAGPEYATFRFAAAHSRYIHDTIVKREAGAPSPFWGFRLNEHRVGLGDLVCQWRNSTRTYDHARSSDAFFSHCDIVVEVAPGSVRALGGNNSHTVGFKTYAINPAGFLKAENKVFAVLRNNV